MVTRYYIAFSIHGSRCFITAATGDVERTRAKGFTRVPSRRPSFDGLTEVKLHWDKLNKKDGKPHTNHSWVLRRFNELKRAGWVVDDYRFREFHFGK